MRNPASLFSLTPAMAYSTKTPPGQRMGTLLLVLLLHIGIGGALLLLGGVDIAALEEDLPIETFDVSIPEPPPPIVEEIETPDEATPREEGAASEENIESTATPIEAPEPEIVVPTPNPIVASPTPNEGNDATQGASDRPGEGTGAGGQGTGTGSGSGGEGTGGGGGTRPTVIQSTTLTGRDYPKRMRRDWPRGARVLVAVRVQIDGRATDCKINGSSGVAAIDAETCRLVEERVRFRPARDARGNPYVAWYGYMQYDVGG